MKTIKTVKVDRLIRNDLMIICPEKTKVDHKRMEGCGSGLKTAN